MQVYDGVQGNGPSVGNGNRNRNTTRNNDSKKRPPAAPAPLYGLTPDQEQSYSTQIAGLQQQYAAAMALQKAQVAAAQGDYIAAKGAAKTDAIAGMAGEVNAQLDRGTLGASFDLAGRGQVLAGQTAAVQAALAAKQQGIANAKLGGLAAGGDFYLGLGGVQASRANAEAMAQIEAFKNDQFDVLQQNFNQMRKAVLQQLSKNRARDAAPGTPAGFAGTVAGAVGSVPASLLSLLGSAPAAVAPGTTPVSYTTTQGLVGGSNPLANGRRR